MYRVPRPTVGEVHNVLVTVETHLPVENSASHGTLLPNGYGWANARARGGLISAPTHVDILLDCACVKKHVCGNGLIGSIMRRGVVAEASMARALFACSQSGAHRFIDAIRRIAFVDIVAESRVLSIGMR